MTLLRIDRNFRGLTSREQSLAFGVFKDKLPAWSRILIGDGLGKDDRPYTWEDSPLYCIHVGPTMYPDLSLTTVIPGDPDRSRYCDLLIHELTHVWQYYNGYWVSIRSIWAQTIGDGYRYTLQQTDCWNDFNVEQQASIVEHWFARGMSTADDRYPFIAKIIQSDDAGEMKEIEIGRLAAINTPVRELREWMNHR